MTLSFDTRFEPRYGLPVEVAPGVRRITAKNPSPFTFHGTNSYIVGGSDALAVIDPGPDDVSHLEHLLKAIGTQPVSHIFVTHTHRDHSPLASRLSEITGAPILAEGPHRPIHSSRTEANNPLDASADQTFRPDIQLSNGMLIEGDGWALRALHTPGHAANHMAFALEKEGITFSGDHVMAWSTTVVAPPDGSMSDYMASLEKLMQRDDRMLLPGHGGPVLRPKNFIRGLKAHRKMRERAIIERLAAGDRTIAQIVAAIYRDLDPRLKGAAALSVLAHLEELVARGRAKTDGPPSIQGDYQLV